MSYLPGVVPQYQPQLHLLAPWTGTKTVLAFQVHIAAATGGWGYPSCLLFFSCPSLEFWPSSQTKFSSSHLTPHNPALLWNNEFVPQVLIWLIIKCKHLTLAYCASITWFFKHHLISATMPTLQLLLSEILCPGVTTLESASLISSNILSSFFSLLFPSQFYWKYYHLELFSLLMC
jgi:hypothetical protein